MTNEMTSKMTNEIMDEQELMNVTGGNWFTDAWDEVCDFCEENAGIVTRAACVVGGIALCATGIGAAAGIGLIAVESVGAAAVVSVGIGSVAGVTTGAIITEDWDN